MKNPWTKKNPLMSMWLSGANAVMGRVRGQATAAAKRETKAATTRGIGSMLNFWTKAATPAPAPAAAPVAAKAKKAAATASTAFKATPGTTTVKKTAAKKTAASRARKKRK